MSSHYFFSLFCLSQPWLLIGTNIFENFCYHFYAFSTQIICFCCNPLSILESSILNPKWLCAKVSWGQVHRSQFIYWPKTDQIITSNNVELFRKSSHSISANPISLCPMSIVELLKELSFSIVRIPMFPKLPVPVSKPSPSAVRILSILTNPGTGTRTGHSLFLCHWLIAACRLVEQCSFVRLLLAVSLFNRTKVLSCTSHFWKRTAEA